MSRPLILASASEIRLQLLRGAGLDVTASAAFIDEDAVRESLTAASAPPRDIADALAEMKAEKVSRKRPADLVLGCDQVLAFQGQIFNKPETPDAAKAQLVALRGQTHHLISAVVLYDGAKPIWRHISEATLRMRDISDAYLDAYLDRNWQSCRSSVGAYKLEEEGVRLFSAVSGDYFTILGLPLLPVLDYLGSRGFIAT